MWTTLTDLIHPGEISWFEGIEAAVKLDGIGDFGSCLHCRLLLIETPIIGIASRTSVFKEERSLLVIGVDLRLVASLNQHYPPNTFVKNHDARNDLWATVPNPLPRHSYR